MHGVRLFRRVAVLAVAGAVGVGVLTGCGGSSSGDNSTPPPSPTPNATAEKAAIAAAWVKAFDPTISTNERVTLLQNGDQLRKAIAVSAKDPNAKGIYFKVTKVALDPVIDPAHPTATVTYSIYAKGNKTPVLKGGVGQAVQQDGNWQVAKSSFCALISQGAAGTPKACQ